MKGPGMRLDLDVRRIWRCPSCDAERRTSGDRTALHCTVCSDRPLMTLIERARPVRPVAQPLDLTIELHPDDVDAPPALPPGMTAEPTPEPTTGESQQDAAPESHTPPPRTKQTRPERQKRSGKRPNRRRPRRETTEGAAPATPAAASPAAAAPSGKSASTDRTGPSSPSAGTASASPAAAPTVVEPDRSSSADSREPEAFGDGLLDG